MKVAIIGSRKILDSYYSTLCSYVPIGASEIISGGAQGADALAARYAAENNLFMVIIAPNYQKYGRRAPLMRNQHIIERADYVLAMWDGHSRGTAQAIDACIRSYVPVRIIMCSRNRPHPVSNIK